MRTYDLTLTAIDHIHHGAGTAGNTSLLRTQPITLPDGTPTTVPFISGNSLRHQLRVAAAIHALKLMHSDARVSDGRLPKAVIDLLWSGGALTKTGAQTDLQLQRDVAALFPALALFGYSAGSAMVASTLKVDNLHLVCTENGWRLPPRLAGMPQAAMRAAAFRSDEFGTRHDASRSAAAYTDPAGHLPETTQMIYDMQTIKPGAVLHTQLTCTDHDPAQLAALAAAVRTAAPQDSAGVAHLRIGAKTAVGLGRCQLDGAAPLHQEDITKYEERIADDAEDILNLLERLVA